MGLRQRARRRLAADPNPRCSSPSPPVPRAPSSLSAVHSTGCPPTPNYASTKQKNTDDFCKYLRESDTVLSYAIRVDYYKLMELGGLDLTIATCNDRQYRQYVFLVPAGKMFLKEKKFGDEKGRRNTSFIFSDFPKSMLKLGDFLLGRPLVEKVFIFGGHRYIHSPTAYGRHFLQMLVAALFENYLKGIFLNGEFSPDEIVIFDYPSPCQRIEILRKPAEADKWTEKMCNESKAKDMCKVADLIMLHYMKGGVSPPYFHGLINHLQTVTCEEVGEHWFKDYLCYHVAFMHSDGRKYLETSINSIIINCKGFHIPFMAAKPPMHLDDWRTMVNKTGQDYIFDVLNGVYKHNSTPQQPDPYDESVRGLLKYKRNVFEHCGNYIYIEANHLWHLELCTAVIFPDFLSILVRTLLVPENVGELGPMETIFSGPWEGFKRQGLR